MVEKNETGVWEKISYTWTIPEIDSQFKEKAGHKLTSPSFDNNHDGDYVWNIVFYPTGINHKYSDFLSVYLCSVSNPEKDVETKFAFSVRDSGDCVIKTITVKKNFNNDKKSCGYPGFMERSDALSVVKDNIIKIHTDIFMKIHNLEREDCIVLLGPNFPEVKLQSSMAGLLDSGKFSDVAFHVGEKIFQVHKNILCARSPVFEAMFAHNSIESQSGVVNISDFDSENFKRFLSFVYSGQVNITAVDVAIELFRAAEKYDFEELKSQCVNYISSNINANNIGPVLLFTETFNLKNLKRIAMNYILENVEIFCNVEMEVYTFIEKQCPKLFAELLVFAFQNLVLKNREE